MMNRTDAPRWRDPITLSPPSAKGVLITFEGVDGSGKTTSLRSLSAWLSAQGVRAHVVKMPSPDARQLPYFRAFVDDYAAAIDGRINLCAVSLVMLADRLVTLRTTVEPLLRAGEWVLCDRYVYMTFAQLAVCGCSAAELESLRTVAALFPQPHVAFVAHVEASESLRRIRERPSETDRPVHEGLYQAFARSLYDLAPRNSIELVPTKEHDGAMNAMLRAVSPILRERETVESSTCLLPATASETG